MNTAAASEDRFDLTVIGAGPGGYVCAIRAAQLGMRVACVDAGPAPGGTCLNVGCIPSKALLHASEVFEETAHLSAMGISVGAPRLDLAAMMAFKDSGVEGNTRGVGFLLEKNKVALIAGRGRIVSPGCVEVSGGAGGGGNRRLDTGAIVIASGSEAAGVPGIEVDEERIVSSTGALSLSAVPETLVVIGGGYIGLELGSVWRRLGSRVTVVEYLDRITPGMDGEVARQFQRILEKQGMTFKLGTKVVGAKRSKGGRGGLDLVVEKVGDGGGKSGGKQETLQADVVLVSTGRVANTRGLGLDEIGVALDERGRIRTDARFQTSVEGIYAIGDVIAGPMLAHKAEDEGMAVAEILAGQSGHVNYDVIPGVVYTFPEAASVGRTAEELKEAGVEVRVGKFPFTANGRAKVNRTTDGFVKILAAADGDRVLGVHMIGADAGNMIAEAALAMEFGASAEDIARTCHAHPTLTEAVKEAALAVAGRAIHM